MARRPNTKCQYCNQPLYRRPIQLIRQEFLVCGKCRSKQAKEIGVRKNLKDYNEYIRQWKDGFLDGMRGQTAISAHISKYLRTKYNNSCCKCGWNKINLTTGKIPLEINHIDGIHTNNQESNLELVCPNCHSLTSNYRALNKGKGRIR